MDWITVAATGTAEWSVRASERDHRWRLADDCMCVPTVLVDLTPLLVTEPSSIRQNISAMEKNDDCWE